MPAVDCNENFTVKLYRRRWVVLVVLMLTQCLTAVSYTCFGQVGDFFVTFFQVSYDQVDWITLGHMVAPMAITLPLLWTIHNRKFGLRKLSITAAGGLTVVFLCLTLCLCSRKLFAVAMVGQLVGGITATFVMMTSSTFPVLWFPEDEIGTAIAVNTMGLYLGIGIGTAVPTIAIHKHSHLSEGNTKQIHYIRDFFLIMNGCFALISLFVTIFFISVAADRPPTAPTKAQAIKQASEKNVQSENFFKALKRLACDNHLWLTSAAVGIMVQIITLEFMLLPEMLRELTQQGRLSINADRCGGYLLVVYSIGAVVGTIAIGRVMDVYKNYKSLANTCSVVTTVSAVGFALGFCFANLPVMFASNFVYGVGNKAILVVLFEVATQHTYPIDETFASTWLLAWMNPIGIIIGEIGRLLFDLLGHLAVLVFQSVCLLACSVMVALLSPKRSRLEMNEKCENEQDPNCNESLALLDLRARP